MRHDTTPRRSAVASAVSLLLALFALIALASTAAAHGGGGVVEVGEPSPTGDLTVLLPMRVTYESDGHPAEPDEIEGLVVRGERAGQIVDWSDAVAPGEAPGVYEATLTFPSAGEWQVTVEVAEPAATSSLVVVVDDPAVTPTTEAGTTDASADDGAPPGTLEITPVGQIVDQDDGGSSPVPLVVAMLACVALAAGAAVLLRRARRRPDAPS